MQLKPFLAVVATVALLAMHHLCVAEEAKQATSHDGAISQEGYFEYRQHHGKDSENDYYEPGAFYLPGVDEHPGSRDDYNPKETYYGDDDAKDYPEGNGHHPRRYHEGYYPQCTRSGGKCSLEGLPDCLAEKTKPCCGELSCQTVDSNTTVQGSDCGGLCADFGCNICATTSATCPAGTYVVAITGSAGGSFYEVTDLGPLLCSDGTAINLHPSEGECVLRTTSAPKNSTARKGKREQSPQSLTIRSSSGFTGVQMYGGCVLDMFRPISTLAHFTDPQKFFGDDSLEGVAVYASACPTGQLLSGLTVSWSDWETLIDGGAGIPFIPVKVGLQCREVVGKCAP